MNQEKNSLKELDLKEICLNKDFGTLKFERALPKLEILKEVIVELNELNYNSKLTTREVNEVEAFKSGFDRNIELIRELK